MVELIDETTQWQHPEQLERDLRAYLHAIEVTQDVTVVLCDDAFIRTLNQNDRNLDETTDVLSYPLHEPDDVNMPEVGQLGDIFISIDTAKRQAVTHNLSLIEEVLTLAAHGITHLRGFDHPTEEAWKEFHEAQNLILQLRQQNRSLGEL